MKTIFLTGIFCLLNACVFSQDTLFFKNSGKSVVIVKEISPTEIQYRKFEMPDGPMYIVSKNDIEKIIYKNGYTEILAQSTTGDQKTPASADKPFSVQSETPYINNGKITFADTKKRYYTLAGLVNSHPDPKRKEPLMKMVNQFRSLRRHEKGTRTCAIIFGGFALAGAGLYAITADVSSSSADNFFAMPPIVLGSIAAAFTAASITIHVNLTKKRKAFVKLYNE